jgi:oligoribonuclease (3'-5' exoribonuclease)
MIDELDLQLKPDPGMELNVTEEALRINGINLEQHLKDPRTMTYSSAKTAIEAFLIKNKIKGRKRSFRPCGQNIEFDIKFIKALLIEHETWDKYIHYRKLDNLDIITFLQDIGFFPNDIGNLESQVEYLGLPKGLAHNAKEDVKMTVEVYKTIRKMFINNKSSSTGLISSDILSIIEER